jgi:hypothetical protein
VREIAGYPDRFKLARSVDGDDAPLELHGTAVRLFVQQVVTVDDGHCRTESYSYRLLSDASTKSWLIRWEYVREPPQSDYAYPRAHVHFNGTFFDGQPAGRLHIPTRLMPLELVIWHLIADWGIAPKSDDWQTLLAATISAG